MTDQNSPALQALRTGEDALWLRPGGPARFEDVPTLVSAAEIGDAADRFERFAPILARLFADRDWDGQVRSDLFAFPEAAGAPPRLLKGDHALPMTGSIKARGGVHELLAHIEHFAHAAGIALDDPAATAAARPAFARLRILVASTGNLGYSIGLVARAFGVSVDIHMSRDAKAWKKDALRALGATVVEHDSDYSAAVARAREAAAAEGAIFIDDENSRLLLTGYAVAAAELAQQLADRSIPVTAERPIVVYLPCGVGGAPGGITLGLKRIFGEAAICLFVEPVESACMLAAMASGERPAPDVYHYGRTNRTIADGLAVPRASDLVLDAVGPCIDGVLTVSDAAMTQGVRRVWRELGQRIEPSAAAGPAAFAPFLRAAAGRPGWEAVDAATHIFWATGGSRLPDAEFLPLIDAAD